MGTTQSTERTYALPGRMLTTSEAAEVLRCTRLHLTDMLRTGLLPGVRFGRKWLIPEDTLAEWIAQGGRALDGGWRKEAR